MIKELKPSKKRTEEDRSRLMATVGDIIADVRMNGDAALMEYNRRFDGCERTALRISEQEIRDAYDKVSAQEIEDIISRILQRRRERQSERLRISHRRRG